MSDAARPRRNGLRATALQARLALAAVFGRRAVPAGLALAALPACLALAAALGAPAGAQPAGATRPLIVRIEDESNASQREAPPLAPEQMARLVEARRHRERGNLAAALESLAPLIAEAPHHPLVLRERCVLHLVKQEYAAVERLARAERLAQKDSVLLAHEMVQALERLGRGRDAAQVAVEAWAADGRESAWAGATVVRLLPTATGAIRDLVRRAAGPRPERLDLALGLARVEWRLGDVRAAVKAVSDADAPGVRPMLRWSMADEMIRAGGARDSTAAAEMWLDLAGDERHDAVVRMAAARRAWEVFERRGAETEGAGRVAAALEGLRGAEWPSDLLIAVSRGLQKGGRGAEARVLLETRAGAGQPEPRIALERALADLRDGPPERALPRLAEVAATSSEAAFNYAEGLFFAGQTDSAMAWYQRASEDPQSPHAGAALERLFLLEEARPPAAALAFGEIAYRRWRGDTRGALARVDSLYRALDRGPTWAFAALLLSDLREAAGDRTAALEPVLALIEALPEDREASRARQRAGDLYLALGEGAKAVEHYEECLARYPRAWNAPEVRRKLETLRREGRF